MKYHAVCESTMQPRWRFTWEFVEVHDHATPLAKNIDFSLLRTLATSRIHRHELDAEISYKGESLQAKQKQRSTPDRKGDSSEENPNPASMGFVVNNLMSERGNSCHVYSLTKLELGLLKGLTIFQG